MKIYLAALWPPNHLKIANKVLLSYYDINISSIPFRKETFKIIQNANKQNEITKGIRNS
jgi:hypothetical protein